MTGALVDRRLGVIGDVAIKMPVRAATTAAISLEGLQTIDDVVLASGDRVLVKNQTDPIENGIYEVDSGAWMRTVDCNGPNDVVNGTLVFCVQGTVNVGKLYELTTADPITIDTSSLTFNDVYTVTGISAFAQTLLDDADAGDFLTTLGVTAWAQGLLDDATAGDGLTTLGISAFAQTLLDDADAGDVLTTLGITAFAQTLLDDAAAGDVLTTLGVTAFAKTLLDDAAAGDALTTLGLSAFIKTLVDDSDAATARATLNAMGPLRGYLAGLGMSTAGSSATFTVAAGEATDVDKTALMVLSASLNKTTSAWAVGSGNGALDAGSIANTTWYHVYLIRRSDTGVVDVLISTNATTPTMPANYDQKRCIGSIRTNGSAQWLNFKQNGDSFRWTDWVADRGTPGGASYSFGNQTRNSQTLTVPTGRVVFPEFLFQAYGGAAGASIVCTSLDETDFAPTYPGKYHSSGAAAGNGMEVALTDLHTNTSAQIGVRANANDAGVWIVTMGWRDLRGRFD